MSSGRPRSSLRQPSATPIHRDPRHRRYRPVAQTPVEDPPDAKTVKPEKEERWLTVLVENTKLIVNPVTWSDELVEYISEAILTSGETKNVKLRRGKHRGSRIIEYLKGKSYDHFVEFLDLLSDQGYSHIKSELWKDLVEHTSTTDDDFESEVDSFIRQSEEKTKSYESKFVSMERENKELKLELAKRDKEMQVFLKSIIDTVKNYAQCNVDTGPTVKLEMKTCSNVIQSAFSQLTKRIQTAESNTSKETVDKLESEIHTLSEMNSKQEARLLKYEKQLLEAREEVEIIKRQAGRKDKERAQAIEELKDMLREKQDEIAQMKQCHRDDMAKINAQFEEMKQKQQHTTVENDRKLSEVKDEYNWRMTNMQKEHERKMAEIHIDNESLKKNVARAESRMEARMEKMERRWQKENEMTSENVAQLPRLLTRSNSRMIDYTSSVPGLTVKRMSRQTDT